VHPQRSRTRARTAASRERSREIRAWAEQQGFSVAEHGRLPANVVHEYDLAHGGRQPAGRTVQRPVGRKAAASRATEKPEGRAKPSRRRRTGPLAHLPPIPRRLPEVRLLSSTGPASREDD
jgi:hypothetical protein